VKGATYKFTGESIQISFQYKNHINLTVTTVAEISEPIQTSEIILSLTVAAHVKIGSNVAATTTDMILPAGVWPLVFNKDQTISVIKLTASDSGMASIIMVEE